MDDESRAQREPKHNFIGIKIDKDEPTGIRRSKQKLHHCANVGEARLGRSFYVHGEDICCPLARYYLGIDRKTKNNIETLKEQMTIWEDADDINAAQNYLDDFPTFRYNNKFFSYFPLEKAKVSPDLIIRILKPHEAFEFVRATVRKDGRRMNFTMSGIGSMCGECTVWVLTNNKPTISVGCQGSRRRALLKPSELFLAGPNR